MLDYPEDFDPRFTPWAQWVLGEEESVDQPGDGSSRFMDEYYEYLAMEVAAKRIGALKAT